MLKVSQAAVEAFLKDPVMAAAVLLGFELDTFQCARLRYLWWVPFVIDSSGVSTGKTAVNFVYACLRCVLIPDHRLGVYFPNFSTGIDEFWPYFGNAIERSPIFREQLKISNKKVGEHKNPGAWSMDFKNGSRIIMPAPSFMTDASTQATRRFNTLIVDDYLRAEDMGEGIGKQLIDRVTRAGFNKNHPLWANHIKLFGHAETPQHKGYQRVKAAKRAIKDGSTWDALVTFCYKDWSPKFAEKYLILTIIRKARQTLPKDQFRRQYLGIWTMSGTSYYPEITLSLLLRKELVPVTKRVLPQEYNFLGWDTAPGQSIRADWCAGTTLRAILVPPGSPLEVTMRTKLGPFHLSFTYSLMLRNLGGPEISGVIHHLDQRFGFRYIMMDPGGGGLMVYKELKKPEQLIYGARVACVPLAMMEDVSVTDRRPKVLMFKRGTQMNPLFEHQYMVSDDGLLDAAHRMFRESVEGREVVEPAPMWQRSAQEIRGWTPEQVVASRCLEAGYSQLLNVRQVAKDDGTPMLSKRGFAMFEAKGKKDVAYSRLYAYMAFRVWLKESEIGLDDEGDDGEFIAG